MSLTTQAGFIRADGKASHIILAERGRTIHSVGFGQRSDDFHPAGRRIGLLMAGVTDPARAA